MALRFVTAPPGATSAASAVRTPSKTALLVPGQAPFRQWYAKRTGFVPAAFHVADPAFVNDAITVAVPFADIVDGSVFAPHVTA